MLKFSSKTLDTENIGISVDASKLSVPQSNMIRGIIVFALLGVALASRSANQYVENVIQTSLPNELRALGLNPAPLPAFNMYLPSNAQVNFINGNVTGFALVKRKSECQGPKMVYGELTINCTLSLNTLSTGYTVQLNNGSRVYNAKSSGRVSETLVYVVIAGRPQNYVGYVKLVQVQKLGVVSPTVSGLPQTFSRYARTLEDAYRANVSTYLLNVIQYGFVNALSRSMSYKPMPRQ